MSSPSPGPQSGPEHTYQPSDSSDHALISHTHTCQCSEKPTNIDPSKCESNISHSHLSGKSSHHHNLINLSTHGPPTTTTHTHPTNQSVHVHVHAPPSSTHPPKLQSSTCNCHLQVENENPSEILQTTAPSRKIEADDRIEVSPLPPALPPRPPPRPRTEGHSTLSSRSRIRERK